jgi:hypothetical protein
VLAVMPADSRQIVYYGKAKPANRMDPAQGHEELIEALERIVEALESISDKQGVIANSLLQLSDRHGSTTPGPYR